MKRANRNSTIVLYLEGSDLYIEGYSSKKELSKREGYDYAKLKPLSGRWFSKPRLHVKLPMNNFKPIKISLDELEGGKKSDSSV